MPTLQATRSRIFIDVSDGGGFIALGQALEKCGLTFTQATDGVRALGGMFQLTAGEHVTIEQTLEPRPRRRRIIL